MTHDSMMPVFGAVVLPDLTADTLPRVIAVRQRRDVWDAWRAGLTEIAAISEAVLLPAWTVWRRLRELGVFLPKPVKAKSRKGQNGRSMRAYPRAG